MKEQGTILLSFAIISYNFFKNYLVHPDKDEFFEDNHIEIKSVLYSILKNHQ